MGRLEGTRSRGLTVSRTTRQGKATFPLSLPVEGMGRGIWFRLAAPVGTRTPTNTSSPMNVIRPIKHRQESACAIDIFFLVWHGSRLGGSRALVDGSASEPLTPLRCVRLGKMRQWSRLLLRLLLDLYDGFQALDRFAAALADDLDDAAHRTVNLIHLQHNLGRLQFGSGLP